MLVSIAVACGKPPASYPSYLLTDEASVIFAEQQTNGQYCIYRKDSPLDAGAKLLTSRSVARDDIVLAMSSEAAHLSYVFNLGTFAMYPATIACISSGLARLALKHRVSGAAAFVACGATAILFSTAYAMQDKGMRDVEAEVDRLLSEDKHETTALSATTVRILSWLVTENSISCRRK